MDSRRSGRLPAKVLMLAFASAAAPFPAPAAEGIGLLAVLELTLAHDPNIALVETQVTAARGSLLSAEGRFDPVIDASLGGADLRTPVTESTHAESTSIDSSFGVAKEFRGGLSITPSIQLSRSDAGGAPVTNEGTVAFTFRQPLLRGRGRDAVAAGVLSATHEHEASRLDLLHATSQRIAAVARQYWRTVAARLDLEILRASEASSRRLLETTRKLIAADLTPAAEIVQLEADLTAKEASRIGGEQTLFQSRQDLGREVGLEAARIRVLPVPSERFPVLPPAVVPEVAAVEPLLREALARRADLRAAAERLKASEIRLAAADDALQPRLDLVLTPSYSGLVEGADGGDFFAPLARNVPGLSTTFGFSLSWPTFNRQARGDLLRGQADLRDRELRIELTRKAIGADVPTALDAVRRSAEQLTKATAAVRLFEQAVINEEKKLRAGSSTLIDVISQKDRLTSARQREVSAQLALALALVDLRFQTGTLLAADGVDGTLDARRLVTVPFQDTDPFQETEP